MKTVGWAQLRNYGINPLTGEACPYSMRMPVDLTDKGQRIVCDMLGLPGGTKLNENWNSGSSGSLMIPRSLFSDLYVWCLVSDGIDEILACDGEAIGRELDDQDEWLATIKILEEYKRPFRCISPIGGTRRGTRMVHQMTERSE